jgi:hypothetical protein
MATTTNYGWTTPDDTALVKDGAAAIRTLGSSVDTTTKNLNPSTTLGDIEYRSSTANTNTRLGIGTTGQVLAVSGGVPAWTTAASAAPTSANALVATSQTTTSTSYTDLATAGPAVTITTGTKALVIISAKLNASAAGNAVFVGFAVSGATTIAAADASALGTSDAVGARPYQSSYVTKATLTAGSNTFTLKYVVSGGTGTFANREITVIDLGS